MADLRLSRAADADLVAILDYSIAQFGRDVAEAYLRGFEQAFDLLKRHPQAGAVHRELTPPIRYFPYRSHLIFYDFKDDTVLIVRILYRAMDVEARLGE